MTSPPSRTDRKSIVPEYAGQGGGAVAAPVPLRRAHPFGTELPLPDAVIMGHP